MRVDYLMNHSEHVETVARWIYDEWTHMTVDSLDLEVEAVRGRLSDSRIPLCLVALDDGQCIGTVSLFTNDLDSRPDLIPWLAALYVRQDRRNTGVGGALVEEVVAVARRLGVGRLYLHTETANAYYARKGWRPLFRTIDDRGEETEVFDLILA